MDFSKRTLHDLTAPNSSLVIYYFKDCIRNAEEARAMLEAGILPTHVIHLIPPFMPPLNKLLYCDVSKNWPGYRRTIMGVRDVYKSCLLVSN